MARRQGNAAGGQQIDKRIRVWRGGQMHRIQHLFILVRAGDGENFGVISADIIRLGPQATSDDNLAVFGKRFAIWRNALSFVLAVLVAIATVWTWRAF